MEILSEKEMRDLLTLEGYPDMDIDEIPILPQPY